MLKQIPCKVVSTKLLNKDLATSFVYKPCLVNMTIVAVFLVLALLGWMSVNGYE